MLDDVALAVEYPVAVVSDLHLAHPASLVVDPHCLLPLFEGCRTAVFNGDLFEHINLGRRRQARKMVESLHEVLVGRGIRPIYISGNHDPASSSLTALSLCAEKVFITHGDSLHPMLAPWSKEAPGLVRERHRLAKAEGEPASFEHELHVIKRMSYVASRYDDGSAPGLVAKAAMVGRFVRSPGRVVKAIAFWSSVPRLAEEYRRRFDLNYRLMVIGHTHRSGVWKRRDFTLVNTGAFQPLSRPLVVRIDADRADVFAAVRRDGNYRLGRLTASVPLK